MLKKRVIPVLLLQDGGLVKGEKFKKHKYVGDPINAVRIFNEKEVDELAFVDISVGVNRGEPDYELIGDMASEAFMPIAYGGGISRVDQVEKLFRLGVEKVIINSEFHLNPELVTKCSQIAGAQSIVVAIDVKKSLFGKYEVYTKNGTCKTGTCPIEYARKAQQYGAGEIILTSIDREGSAQGLDLDLIKKVTSVVEIPVIVQGGVGSLEHIKDAVKMAGASAVAAGTYFTFHGKYKAVLLTYPAFHELEYLFLD
ncbi:AglZ/HisF2 family acetamidino modification protein [Vibrio anguillarum]|uniref:imidazole glycerol-phosphate synthase n=17 Tax=Vibrio anguillarum TaxID=55601 RepID=A0A289GFD8_VIBAN|nr:MULTISPECIES: AglZ/HisF2 family acetamidino modification protein [Vibrio]ASW82194.1 imidazole glycerol phosphate synthase subunit HisF [Vibrio anguillarum]ATC58711.1 imidazole glycerol phosphate synthase subunit HisF [Vibrio anguillarum]AXN05011.1 imidazole glycerol phosphate synthase subunit HisF [Vibrio anguillarum]AZS24749.1 imidazole glycerol phosphate synthase subunit HisF [Vibrio anguillarum]MBF4217731.1 imidazole glycerol phosphate synthase subunit HisF [Vibrio anguillarum]